jgi:hypothetical protein
MVSSSYGAAPYRVQTGYEDSVRIMIIWNDAQGQDCGDQSTVPVGKKTLDFVIRSIDTTKVHNVKTLVNKQTMPATWNQVLSVWGNKLPHVLVHVNAGWSTGWNGKDLDTIFSKSIQNKIGIVSIGDDAASLASKTFGFSGVENMPEPLNDGTNIDSLWIGLLRANDEKIKSFRAGGKILEYPGVNGIISNAIDSILKKNVMEFFPVGKGRCQADADKYSILYPQWITMLGYQQGLINNVARPDDNALNVLVAIQDTLQSEVIRRGVALSFQPQFIRDSIASQQICYDAILFASLTHTLSVASKIVINVPNDSLIAGQSVLLTAELYDQHGNKLDTMLQYVKWSIITPDAFDELSNTTGESSRFSSTKAWRTAVIRAEFTDPKKGGTIFTTADIHIKPSSPHHIDIMPDSLLPHINLNKDNTLVSLSIQKNQSSVFSYSILRDQYSNFVSRTDTLLTMWNTSSPVIATSSGTPGNAWQGKITRAITSGTAVITIKDHLYLSDSVIVAVDVVSSLRHALTQDMDGNGYIDGVVLYFDTLLTLDANSDLSKTLSIMTDNNKFYIKSIRGRNTTDSVFYIELDELNTSTLQTGWLLNIKGTINVKTGNESGIVEANGVADDGVGVVINRAIYTIDERSDYGDTLKIEFSEYVNRQDLDRYLMETVFKYYSDKTGATIDLLKNSKCIINDAGMYVKSAVIVLNPIIAKNFTIIPFKDKIQLVSGIRDKIGNSPPSVEKARKVVVESGGNNVVKVITVPPLLDRAGGSIRNVLIKLAPDGSAVMNYMSILQQFESKNAGNSAGVLISITSKKPLLEKQGAYGKIIIYDATGQIVARTHEVKKTYNSQEYAYIWNAKNDKGRLVGAGTYLIVITVTDIDNITYTEKQRVGIQFENVIGLK